MEGAISPPRDRRTGSLPTEANIGRTRALDWQRKLQYVFITALAAVFFLCVLSAFATPGAFSDMGPHMEKHVRIMAGEASTAYPLMYYAAEAIHGAFNLPLDVSYGIFLGACSVFVLFTLYWFFRRETPVSPALAFLSALSVSVMLHVYIPGWVLGIYYGQGGGNAWLNPSFTAMKPFAVAAFLAFALLMDNLVRKKGGAEGYVLLRGAPVRENALYAAFVLACALSMLAKPSFVFGFVFAAAILFLIRIRYFEKKFFFVMLVSALAMGALLLLQFGEIFKETGLHSGGIIFSPARAVYYAGTMTKSIPLSLASNLLYPVVMLALFNRDINPLKNNVYLLSWVFYGVSLVIGFTLSEGSFPEHLNMEWTRSIAIFLLNTTATLEYLKRIAGRGEARDRLGKRARTAYDVKLGAVFICLLLELYTGIVWLGMYI